MNHVLMTIGRAVLSIIAAWLLWGGILNGAAHLADVFGRDSPAGSAFRAITLWLGHFGFGILFFVILSAVLFVLTGLITRKGQLQERDGNR
jgi:hypothetical protein